MEQPTVSQSVESEIADQPNVQFVHSMLRLVLAVRYRKNLVAAVMAAAVLLGGLYYATATRRYSAKAALLVTQTGPTASIRRSPTTSRCGRTPCRPSRT